MATRSKSGFKIPAGAEGPIEQAEKQGFTVKYNAGHTQAWLISPDGHSTVHVPNVDRGNLNNFKNALRRAGAVIDGEGGGTKLSVAEAVRGYITLHPDDNAEKIAKGLGLPVQQVRDTLATLHAKGKVVNVATPANAPPEIRTLDEAREALHRFRQTVDRSSAPIPRTQARWLIDLIDKSHELIGTTLANNTDAAQKARTEALRLFEEARNSEERAEVMRKQAAELKAKAEEQLAEVYAVAEAQKQQPAAAGSETHKLLRALGVFLSQYAAEMEEDA